MIEDKDELVEGEKRDAKLDKDDTFEKAIVCSQRNEPRDEDELPVGENGEDALSIEYAKQRESIKKIQDRVYEVTLFDISSFFFNLHKHCTELFSGCGKDIRVL